MKALSQILLAALLISAGLSSCSGPAKDDSPAGKRKQLAEYRSRLKELQTQIAELEKDLAKTDSSFSAETKTRLVTADTIRLSEFKHFIDVQGSVEADKNMLVAPQMPGVVTAIFVNEGDAVKAGQLLAQTDGSVYERGMEELRNGLELATIAYEKQKRLWDQNIGSEIQFLQAKNTKEGLEKKMQTLRSQLEMTRMKSPVNGVVDEVKLKLGEMASPGYFGVRVVNSDKLTLRARLSDTYIDKVKKGDVVEVLFPDINKRISSVVTYVAQTVDQRSRTFNVDVKLDNRMGDFKANMIAKLLINDQIIKEAVVLPGNLIQQSAEGKYVLVAVEENGKKTARRKAVETGSQYNGLTVITRGLQPGDRVITFGYSELVDGQIIDF